MKKVWLLLLALWLAACNPAAPEAGVQEEPTAVAPLAAVVEEAPTVVAAEPSAAVEAEESEPETAVAQFGTPEEVLAEAQFAREGDKWLGTDDPLITIIEYADFQ